MHIINLASSFVFSFQVVFVIFFKVDDRQVPIERQVSFSSCSLGLLGFYQGEGSRWIRNSDLCPSSIYNFYSHSLALTDKFEGQLDGWMHGASFQELDTARGEIRSKAGSAWMRWRFSWMYDENDETSVTISRKIKRKRQRNEFSDSDCQ